MIEVNRLVKQFGGRRVVDDLTFSLSPGQILGFLGPNGAGKSTTMKMLTGFLAPDSGEIRVLGHDVLTNPRQAQANMGYLPEGAPCYDEMTPLSFLSFIANIRGFSGDEKKQRIDSVVGKMALEDVLGQRIETLSKGFKRRVGLAQALIHDPRVLILDEPTDGLDPNQKHQVRELIRGLSKDKIVIISTHILEEVAAVCNRVMIINKGRLVKDCAPKDLEAESRYQGAVTVKLDESGIQEAEKCLASLTGVTVERVDGGITVFSHQSGDSAKIESNMLLPIVSGALEKYGLVAQGIYLERGRLDDVFRTVTEEVAA